MDDLAAVEAAIYDQSFRALDEQARVLDSLRARAGNSLLVMTPRVSWASAHHPHRLLAAYLKPEPPVSLATYHRTIAYYNGAHFDANARQLRWLFRAVAVASVCLALELVVWLWILAR